jgi:hypothetical protein
MFGYLNVNQPEMKIKEYNKYHSYYCGLCNDLQNSFGLTGKLTLTYDMTFLAILLSSLYEPTTSKEMIRCPLHPVHKQPCRTNWCTEYVADMNFIASCYQLQDDYLDEHKVRGYAGSLLYRRRFHKLKQKYPKKIQSINHSLHLLRACEQSNESNIDKVLGYSGEMIAELFVPKEDIWASTLRETGFYLGKFIYLMDAFEDLDKDEENGCYNPLLPIRKEEDFALRCESYLVSTISQCTKSFERLPLVEDIEILRNILYSGIWTRYELIKSGKINKKKH